MFVASLDVGTSSVRALLFDAKGVEQEAFTQQIKYEPLKTPDGGVEVDPDQLLLLCVECLDGLQAQLAAQ